MEEASLGRSSNSSPIMNLSETPNLLTEVSKNTQSPENPDKEDALSHYDNREPDNHRIMKELSKDSIFPTKPLFDQMEDAVTKAKLIAAQQFLLQNFHKQREALISAQNVSSISALQTEDHKKQFTPFLFSTLPFGLPPPSIHFPGLPNMPKNNNRPLEAFQVKKDIEEDVQEKKTESDIKEEECPNKGQTENAFLLFSKIQKYRQQMIKNGNSKVSSDSIESNPIRSCEKLITPFLDG